MSPSKIEWTDETWNPITGCEPVSEGCENCYARRMSRRLKGRFGYPEDEPFRPGTVHESQFAAPLSWVKPRRVFVCSMGDLFHREVDYDDIAAVLGIAAACPQHTFQILTKRPQRALEFFQWVEESFASYGRMEYLGEEALDRITAPGSGPPDCTVSWWWGSAEANWQNGDFGHPEHKQWPLPNVHIGVTAENQETANERIQNLVEIPATVRFVSCEPLLEHVNLGVAEGLPVYKEHDTVKVRSGLTKEVLLTRPGEGWKKHSGNINPWLDWVVAGAESGPGARPTDIDWVRSLRDQCQAAHVPFFMKQLCENGKKIPFDQVPEDLQVRDMPGKRKPELHTYRLPECVGGDWAVRIENVPTEDHLLGTGIVSDGFETEAEAREWAENRLEDMEGERDE